MPTRMRIPITVDNYNRGSHVFVKSASVFRAASLGKITPATDSQRQAHFHRQLALIARSLRTPRIPVFFESNGRRLRLDKGCIGHAVAAGVIANPRDSSRGYVEHVDLLDAP